MLTELHIKNFAIIEDVKVKFGAGFNVITGETGAGKSILLKALDLVLGGRSESKYFKEEQDKTCIEAWIDLKSFHLKKWFSDNDLDYQELCIMRREFFNGGKNRSFINDSPVSIVQMRQLGHKLISIHSQFETYYLQNTEHQLEIIDQLLPENNSKDQYVALFESHKALQKTLEDLLKIKSGQGDTDYLRFQLNEIQALKVKKEEYQTLKDEFIEIENLHAYYNLVDFSDQTLSAGDSNAIDFVGQVIQQWPKTEGKSTWGELKLRLESVKIELTDIHQEIMRLGSDLNADPNRKTFLEERIGFYNALFLKYKVNSEEELLSKMHELEKQIDIVSDIDHHISKKAKEIEASENELKKIGENLHNERLLVLENLSKNIPVLLQRIGMAHPTLHWNEKQKDLYDQEGLYDIELTFSANKGVSAKPIKAIASGGELSRLSLAIKYLISKKTKLSTAVYDEIDAGISGEIGFQMGQLIREMSAEMQIIVISHLPQVACWADHHYGVFKNQSGAISRSKTEVLKEKEKIQEIAKMLAGSAINEHAIANAQELILQTKG